MTQSRPTSALQRRYTLAGFILRGEPPHLGHLAAMRQGYAIADQLMVCLGSANAARSAHYAPFTAAEREQMIRLMLTPQENRRTHFLAVEDQGNMPKWTKIIRAAANAIEPDDKKIVLIGHAKDNSSFYLTGFRGWEVKEVDNYLGLSSTDIRDLYFHPSYVAGNSTEIRKKWGLALHPEVQDWLKDFARTNPAYNMLLAERIGVDQDRATFGAGNQVAATAIVIHGDHVLVTRRTTHPYSGCDSLPGVIIDPKERIQDALVRAACDKGGLKIPRPVLDQSLIRTVTVDEPWRDPRGRIIDFVGLFYLNPVPPASMTDPEQIQSYLALPRIRQVEGQGHNQWMPIASVKRQNFAFDHYQNLQNALDFIPKD